jgi:thiosulfate/3-mercaptopyruvate sulfurtransferase
MWPRFHGTVPEPRPWLSSGHAPNAVSLPFSTLLTPTSPNDPSAYQTLLPHDQLRKVIADAAGGEAGLERVLSGERKVITSCGSGMTAAVVWLALHELGAQDVALYDEVRSLSPCFSGRATERRSQSWMGYAGRKESKIIRS